MGYHKFTLETLLLQTANGSRDAFRELYSRTRKMVYMRVYDIVGNQTDAEDVMQETYVKVWRNSCSFNTSKGRASTWIAAIAHHTSINFIRSRAHLHRSRTHNLDFAMHVMDESQDADVDIYIHQRKELILAEIKSLTPAQQQVLELGYIKGLSYREISQLTGEPEGTLKSRARRAIMKLREQLQGSGLMSEFHGH